MGLVDFKLEDIGSLFKDLREAITGKGIEDPNKQAEIRLKLEQLEQAIKLGQIEINKEEAKHKNIFVSGARPFILWVCGIAIAYNFVLAPLLFSILKAFGVQFTLPDLDMGTLFNLMSSMLGLSALRTYEKVKGVNHKHD